MSVLTDQYLDDLRFRLPGALDGVMLFETFNIIDELCRTIHLHRAVLEVPLTEGQSLYTLDPPWDIVVFFEPTHQSLNVSDIVISGSTISLANVPSATDATTPLFLPLAYAPRPQPSLFLDDMLPAELWRQHYDMIKDGVLSRMMSQLAKPYSNAAMAALHGRRYRSASATARHLTNTGNVPGAQRWRFPFWK